MGLLQCPFCEQKIDSEAKKCFFCGAELNHDSLHIISNQSSSQNSSGHKQNSIHKIKALKIVLIILLFVFFLYLVLFLFRYFH